MDDPIKIIHKYKNNNRRIQYHIYIFIGDLNDDSCMKILRKIQPMDFYTTLVSLDSREIDIITKRYGEQWYTKFFNSYHIVETIKKTIKNSSKLNELKSIYGDEWVKKNFSNYKKTLSTVSINYEMMIKDDREKKQPKKLIHQQQQEIEEDLDYNVLNFSTEQSRNLSNNIRGSQDIPFKIKDEQPDYCQDESSEEIFSDSTKSDDEVIEMDGGENLEEEEIEFDSDAPPELDFANLEVDSRAEEFDKEVENEMDNLDIIFGDLDDTDKNVKQTAKEIREAISNESYEKLKRKIADFDSSKDNSAFDENLKDVYNKYYITQQYIYKDDTIKTIHKKICCGFKNNDKFGDNTYIIPSYQYLWSEYYFNNKIEKVMIGQKWIIRNDVLKLDVEPNDNLNVYEELRSKLKILRDNIRRQGKIKREDDENNILYDYEGFYTYNELYMIDIYNELGLNFSSSFENIRNLVDVYFKIYFPRIRPDDVKNILDFLNLNAPMNRRTIEINKLQTVFDTLNNDLILENEIMHTIEETKRKNQKEYIKLFKENYVTQSVIRAYLIENNQKLDLFRIFDNFVLSEEYPFVQFKPNNGTPRYRYSQQYLSKNEKKEIIMKWFENSPYGISFKIRIDTNSDYKYMAINLGYNGRIDYKIQWKETDMSTIEDVRKTYSYIKNLIKKINSENVRYGINLRIPRDEDFKFAFINTIQKFEIPEKFTINHNDLSDFSRNFFPYISLIIEPKKRQAKNSKNDEEKGKFGTYLIYRRISKYENRVKLEHRIIFFMRNYEYNDESLIDEIAKEFNITKDQAANEIRLVKNKYPNIKKSRKVLKKMENIPKYKIQGIRVDIQGKMRSNYKVRISGARDKEQLDRIITFMNILIYLYVETYLYKKESRQKLKERLKKLTKIAKRRNKVDEFVDYDEQNTQKVKQMTNIDRKRLGYKADENQNQWSRNCQNSGDDKKRRPQQFLKVEDLMKLGYYWVDKLDEYDYGHYERKVMVDEDGNTNSKKKKKQVILRAVKLNLDDYGNNFVFYTCGPEENGKHMYIGFLNKSQNPYGEAMPCCFIKDQLYSKNKEKKNFYLRNIGIIKDNKENNTIAGEQLYILQNSSKIPEGRFCFLPKYLDIFMNFMLNKEYIIENHYLSKTNTGYYFIYGTRQDEYAYLNAVGTLFDLNANQLKNRMISVLEKDNHLSIYTSLKNGNVRNQFGDISNYMNYIHNDEYLDYGLVNDLLSIPGTIVKCGINILIFQKKIRIIKKTLEKEKVKENYYVICQNEENMDDIIDPNRETIFILKENKNYYPIVMIKKESEMDKELIITKTFKYENQSDNIIQHLLDYYMINCKSEYQLMINDNPNQLTTAKNTLKILKNLKDKEYLPKTQIVDGRFKCKYLVLKNNYIVPTIRSGTIYNINISENLNRYLSDFSKTFSYLQDIYDKTEHKLNVQPIGVFYRDRKGKEYLISAIMTNSMDGVPIVEQWMSHDNIIKNKLVVQNVPNDDIIDEEILHNKNVIDDRIVSVAKNNYETELYQLFRYHLSFYLINIPAGNVIKEQIEKIIGSEKSKKEKRIEIKKILYSITNSVLYEKFNKLISKMKGGEDSIEIIPNDFDDRDTRPRNNLKETAEIEDTEEDYEKVIEPGNSSLFMENNPPNMPNINFPITEKKWIHVVPEKNIDYTKFVVQNNRELCYNYTDKKSCSNMQYCQWNNSKNYCLFTVPRNILIDFVNQVTEEFAQNEFKSKEILRKEGYFVSDIVNYNVYTERPGEKVIISSNSNLDNILTEIFGKENIPTIGKRKAKLNEVTNYTQLNMSNPIRIFGEWYVQTIIPNNNTIFRAFANSYYWILHPYSEVIIRNLGYYSPLQTNLSNIYKSKVIDWLRSNKLDSKLISYVKYNDMEDFIINLRTSIFTLTNCIIELAILAKLNQVMIYVYDDNYKIIYVFHPKKNLVYDKFKLDSEFDNSKFASFKEKIHLQFTYSSGNLSPTKINSLYPRPNI